MNSSKTGDLFAITDPDLHLDQLELVQRDVAHLLEHGLNPAPAAELAPALCHSHKQRV